MGALRLHPCSIVCGSIYSMHNDLVVIAEASLKFALDFLKDLQVWIRLKPFAILWFVLLAASCIISSSTWRYKESCPSSTGPKSIAPSFASCELRSFYLLACNICNELLLFFFLDFTIFLFLCIYIKGPLVFQCFTVTFQPSLNKADYYNHYYYYLFTFFCYLLFL